jgi:ATPase subunit of ABC transporter with duplicated ATPase domains
VAPCDVALQGLVPSPQWWAGVERQPCSLVLVGHLDVNAVSYCLPDGRPLLDFVSLRVGEGAKVALIGPNGTGKTSLSRIISGDLAAAEGAVTRSGGLGVMRQFIGSLRDDWSVRGLLVSVAPPAVRTAAAALGEAEARMLEVDDEPAQMAYAQSLADWADAGGYEHETFWEVCTATAIGIPFEQAQWRSVSTLSAGEQKRLVLEALLRGSEEVLLLDEPDNYLDVPAKRWLEDQLVSSAKTVLFVSHDRELLDRVATRIATLGRRPPGRRCGCTPADYRRTTRPGSTGTAGWKSCVAAGMRSMPSSQRSRSCPRTSRHSTTGWPVATTRHRPGWRSSWTPGPPSWFRRCRT